MITSRGWWLLILVGSLLAVGILERKPALALLGLSGTCWFLGEWFLFMLRLRFAVPALRVVRRVRDDRGTVDNLWAGRTFQVRLLLNLDSRFRMPFVRVGDLMPFGVKLVAGATDLEAALEPGRPLILDYSIRPPAPGRIRFEGLRLQCADLQGFFYYGTVLPCVTELRVLPALADASGNRPSVKRHNLLPSPGQHRHLRPGSGSELLELRDYREGDPPKTIAWKVSARRDRLITKEFESEVPIRCTLFVDCSNSVRVGMPGQNALARLVDLASTVAQANSAVRDLTGVVLFDDAGIRQTVRPGRGSLHLVGLMHVLADAAALAPASGQAKLESLLPAAHAAAREIYPNLMRSEVNYVPGWLPWFWNLPRLRQGDPSGWTSRTFRWLFYLVALLPLLAVITVLYFFWEPFASAIAPVLFPLPSSLLGVVSALVGLTILVFYFQAMRVAGRILAGLVRPARRRMARWRKQVAAVLATRYRLGAGGVGLLLDDNAACAAMIQRFLADHHVPFALPYYDRQGRYLFASPEKVHVLAHELMRAVGKGRDNEMFVMLVDLLELEDHLDPLLKAVKVTLARHHQVILICPWPPGIPLATAETPGVVLSEGELSVRIREATIQRFHRAFQRLRRTFARLGVVVVCAAAGDPVRLILDRLDRLRSRGLGRTR